MFLLIIRREKTPISPIVNKYLHDGVYPMIILRIAAKDPPKCHVPSIPIFTRPLYLGGRNSSIAAKTAVN